jgi:predicted acetyltransferase
MTEKPTFNVAQCEIDDIGFIVCKNIEGVVGLLQNEGYPLEKMKSVNDVYNIARHYLNQGGQDAQEKIMMVHPHRLYILEAEEQRGKKSNYTTSAKSLSEQSEDSLRKEKDEIENTLKNPPPNVRIDKNALNARLTDINEELKKRLKGLLGDADKTKKEGGLLNLNLKKEHIFILIVVFVLFVVLISKKS